MSKNSSVSSCVEHGVWTPLPIDPLANLTLDLSAVDQAESDRITAAGSVTFQMYGCAGDPVDQTSATKVVSAMIDRSKAGVNPSFFYHLGDITYVEKAKSSKHGAQPDDISPTPTVGEHDMWNAQFFKPFTKYPKQIFSIAGNHDGKNPDPAPQQGTALKNYLANFCANAGELGTPWKHNKTDKRSVMIQPYPYWRLDTPVCHIIGLYSNIANGGILDDPNKYSDFKAGPQYQWLVSQLKALNAERKTSPPGKAVFLAVHYPPYSGTANFNYRGDPTQGPTNADKAPFLADALQQAFTDAALRPDGIFSAHAHLYQRLTYTFHDGFQMPCFIAGCGGHNPLESMSELCDGSCGTPQKAPYPAVLPNSFRLPKGESALVNNYFDYSSGDHYGFLEVTVDRKSLKVLFIDSDGTVLDSCSVDLGKHRSDAAATHG